MPRCAALWLVLLWLSGAHAADPPFDPTDHYELRTAEGWTLRVNRDLLADAALAGDTLAEVQHQLYQVRRRVPAPAVKRLQTVTLWVERQFRDVTAVYHPNRQWLVEHNYNPEMARCVQLGNARNLLDWSRQQPYMVFHELAHAWHDQVVGWDNAEVQAAYDKAKAGGAYDQVLRYDGKKARHYALNNPQEYFAESSEAFFGTNDFYPFVNAELKAHDPSMWALVAKVWGV